MSPVSTFDFVLMIAGVLYGIVLILSAFISNRLTEAFRLDTFFIANPTKNTRMLNLVFGLFILGSSIYSFWGSFK